jgi:hypothetical protein
MERWSDGEIRNELRKNRSMETRTDSDVKRLRSGEMKRQKDRNMDGENESWRDKLLARYD